MACGRESEAKGNRRNDRQRDRKKERKKDGRTPLIPLSPFQSFGLVGGQLLDVLLCPMCPCSTSALSTLIIDIFK